MRYYPNAIPPSIKKILDLKEQLRKCCNLDFSGLVYSRILIDMLKVVTDVNELALFPHEMKFSSTTFMK